MSDRPRGDIIFSQVGAAVKGRKKSLFDGTGRQIPHFQPRICNNILIIIKMPSGLKSVAVDQKDEH